jgi:alginate O-acetyltransferase complex protein AlgI
LIAGPIVRYHDVARQIVSRHTSLRGIAGGVQRFVIGLAKKVIIANTLAGVADQVFATPAAALAPAESWLGLICYALQIYFDFSGYSDMAIGLGHMFGFTFLENFQYPYISTSIREFWRRWHISLSTWFRDYLYIPLGGNQRGPIRTYLNLLIVFFLCGLWHGASWTFVVWGLYHGVFLIIERTRVGRVLDGLWAPLRHAYVLLAVLGGWVLFRAATLAYAGAFLAVLCGAGSATHGMAQARYYLTPDVLLALLAGTIGAVPILPAAQALVNRWRRPGFVNAMADTLLACGATGYLAALFAWCAMALASGTYNPFIYFRF